MNLQKALYILTFSVCFFVARASNFHDRHIIVSADSIQLDSLSIFPASVFIYSDDNRLVADSLFHINYASGYFSAPQLAGQTIRIQYRTFDENLTEPYYNLDIRTFPFDTLPNNPDKEVSYRDFEEYRQEQNISSVNTNGSIARGFSAGNNQDIIMNSSMNLQMDGYLTNNIQIAAAITDQNIPIQPEGNSQQISEFDQVYIKLYNGENSAIFGDFETANRHGDFLLYNKKGLGTKGTALFELENEKSIGADLSFAISKGKYCSQAIDGMEGNQGPYRIFGCNNESYIVILSGSERVYIDGRLQKRGEDLDYVIDYNSAELTFTSRRPISKDSRITVEFEYSEQNYARFFVTENFNYQSKNIKAWVNVFSEQDNKNQPYQQDTTESVSKALNAAGDGTVYVVNARRDTSWEPDRIYYRMLDTILPDGRRYDSVYVQSVSEFDDHYTIGFAYIGSGKGDYVRIQSSANGKVYAWSAPLGNGTRTGDYLPIRIVSPPEKLQVMAGGAEFTIKENTKISTEISVSNYDKNTASTIGNEDNAGLAQKTVAIRKFNIDSTTSISAYGDYQLVQSNFKPVNSFRPVEFSRDWVLDGEQLGNEHLLNGGAKFESENIYVNLKQSVLLREEQYEGKKQSFSSNINPNGFRAISSASILSADAETYNSKYYRAKSDISQRIAFSRLGITGEYEKNSITDSLDLLRNDAEYFTSYGTYVKSEDSTERSFKIAYVHRTDNAPDSAGKSFNPVTQSQDYSADLGLYKNPDHTFSIGGTYRILSILDTIWGNTNGLDPEKNITARAEHNISLWKSTLRNRLFLETGSGLELKRDYSFVEVTPGQGSYRWIDYNDNGIAELNEFEVAQYQQQANYMRVYLVTNEYIRVYSNTFNHSFQLDPYRIWRNAKGMKQVLGRFGFRSNYSFSRKMERTDFLSSLIPLANATDDVILHSLASSYRGTSSVNKPNHKLSGTYSYSINSNRFLSSNGTESRTDTENSSVIRWNISNMLTAFTEGHIGNKRSDMEASFLSNREYMIDWYSVVPRLDIQPGPVFAISTEYSYTEKLNTINDQESAIIHSGEVEARYSKAERGRLTASFETTFIEYSGSANTALAYTMLEALQPGTNYLWQLMYSRNLSNYLNLSLSYNGQASKGTKTLHMGSVQLKAFF